MGKRVITADEMADLGQDVAPAMLYYPTTRRRFGIPTDRVLYLSRDLKDDSLIVTWADDPEAEGAA